MDIGSLTGQVGIEDQLSSSLTLMAGKVKSFAEGFDGAIGGLAIGVGVLGAAIVGTVVSITALGEEGSKILGVQGAFDRLATSAGTTGETLRSNLSAGVRGTVSDMQLMLSTSKLLGSGMELTGDQAKLMGSAARELGKATGGDAASGLDIMSTALTTGRVRGLQQQIGLIDLAAGEQKFAASIGTTVDQLSEAGKLEGKRIAIFDATQAYLDRLGTSELTFAETVKQGWVAVEEWTNRLATSVATSHDVNEALDTVAAAISAAFGGNSQTVMDAIVDGINAFARGVTAAVPYIQSFFSLLKESVPVLEAVGVGIAAYGVAIGVAAVATTAASVASTVYATTMAVLKGETVELSGAMATLNTTMLPVAATAAAIFAAWKVGQMQPVSDWFMNLGLIIEGYSASERAAMIATDHATQAAIASVPAHAELAKATNAAKAAADAAAKADADHTRFLKDKTAAIDSLVLSLEGDSKTTDITQKAIERVIASENDDVDVKMRVIDSLDKLIKGHIALSDAARKYYEENKEFGTLEIKQAEETAKLWDDYFKTINKGSHDTTAAQISDAYLAADAQIAQMERAKTITLQDYDIIWGKAQATADQIIQKTLESDNYTKEHYAKLADEAKTAYDFALDHMSSYNTQEIQMLLATYRTAEMASNHWSATAYDDMQKVQDKAPAVVGALDKIKSATDAITEAEKELKKARDMGSSFTYDLTTLQGVEQFRSMNTAMDISWSNDQLMDFAKKGGTLQQLFQMGVIHMRPFEEGGPVPSTGPAMLHGGEYVVPKEGALVKSGGGGIQFHAGAIVLNYPIMSDAKSKDMIGRMLGDIFVERVQQLMG